MKYIYIFILLHLLFITNSYEIKVKVQQGIVKGTREATVFEDKIYYAFYGIPFAQSPIGKLRFKDPKPPKKWKKPFDARTEYHGACAQAHVVHKHALYGIEDCLYLNLYTPFVPEYIYQDLKAVIVWIHGYAFTSSFSHIHGADFLINNDVLFISLTHRIGAFGFLKDNEFDINANMGLKDIVMALKWIRKNVMKFGGDKNQITLMGSGSAATLISLLMTTKYKKLFSKVILQSGGLLSPTIFQTDYNLEKYRLNEELRKLGDDDWSTASSKNIVLASQKIYTEKEIANYQKSVVPFTPIVENISYNSIITKRSYDIYKYNQEIDINIPILIGFNSQEGVSEIIPFIHNARLLKTFSSSFKYMIPFNNGCKYNYTSKKHDVIIRKIKEKYFKHKLSGPTLQDLLRYITDLHKYPTYKFIKSLSGLGKTFVYKFNYIGKFNAVKATSTAGTNIKIKGAAQGDEICYILKCEPLWENYVKIKHDLQDRDRKFIKQISKMWANFAKFGDPNQIGNVTWPPLSKSYDNIYLIGEENKLVGTKVEQKMLTFWNKIYSKHYSPEYCQDNHDEL